VNCLRFRNPFCEVANQGQTTLITGTRSRTQTNPRTWNSSIKCAA
jgi:hypothetical protein